MLLAARAMQASLARLKPLLTAGVTRDRGKVVIGTVRGDLHDIGKNLVGMMLEGAGFAVVDLGTNVGPDRFVEAVRAEAPDFVMMSALLTTTMLAMRETIAALAAAGLRDRVRVAVGGAPVSQEFADQLGADFYARDAGEAVSKAKALVTR
jgi:5-methyltetrahydrofolate--homocysteine methyltransferase